VIESNRGDLSTQSVAKLSLRARPRNEGRVIRLAMTSTRDEVASALRAEMPRFEALVRWLALDGLDERVNVDRSR
jgi:hypothetical protein